MHLFNSYELFKFNLFLAFSHHLQYMMFSNSFTSFFFFIHMLFASILVIEVFFVLLYIFMTFIYQIASFFHELLSFSFVFHIIIFFLIIIWLFTFRLLFFQLLHQDLLICLPLDLDSYFKFLFLTSFIYLLSLYSHLD